MSSVKKSILFILHLPPPIHGASMVGQFIKESKIINTVFDTDYINLTTASSLEEIGKTSLKKFMGLLKIQIKVFKSLLKKNHDLCYVSLNAKGSGFYKDFLVVILLKLFRKKIVFHFHNKGVTTMQHKRFNDLLYRYTFNKTKSILLSKLLYYDIAKYVHKEDVFFCPNGIPTVKHNENIGNKEVEKNNICRLLFLSNMMVEKGVYVLLNACIILRQKKIPFECHFVGAWTELSEETMITKVKLKGLSENIILHGKKYGDEKTNFFRDADVFVFPSFYHNECFPLVILEAMQFSLPIISTTIGGIPDMIRNNESGFLIPPNDIEALADKLELLIINPSLRVKMGEVARKIYEEFFTINNFELKMESILENA